MKCELDKGKESNRKAFKYKIEESEAVKQKLANTREVQCLNIGAIVRNEHLSKSISDVGWEMFFNMLDYKAADAGKRTVSPP